MMTLVATNMLVPCLPATVIRAELGALPLASSAGGTVYLVVNQQLLPRERSKAQDEQVKRE